MQLYPCFAKSKSCKRIRPLAAVEQHDHSWATAAGGLIFICLIGPARQAEHRRALPEGISYKLLPLSVSRSFQKLTLINRIPTVSPPD